MTARLSLFAAALLLSTACSTLATLHGAQPLPKGRSEITVAASAQTGSNALSYAGFPIPQLELAGRFGLADDLDLGLRVWMIGAGFDFRYRVWHDGNKHLAIAPAFGGFYLPGAGGSFEVHAPVIGELELARWASVSGGPRVVVRDQINAVRISDEHARVARIDVFAGGGSRLELALARRVRLGFSVDVYAQPARHAIPGWSLGLDVAFRQRGNE